ncbi:MAG TPA: endonuclease MutS2, partial [Synergistaceae bacterium]|nr:endonuclease MutS2 [Synergistaceae bacterium]
MEQLHQRQEVLRAYGRCRDVHGELPWDSRLQPVSPLLEEARETALLTGEELLRFRVLFLVAMQLRAAVAEYRATYPALGALTQGVRDFADELALLECLSDDGRLYDSASPDLAEVRRKLDVVRRDLRQRGARLLNDPGTVAKLQERVLSLRDGRFVVLVRQEHVNSFPGIAIDRSGSGNSVYMEPNALVPHNNKLSLLSRDEERIERKIYRRLTEALLSRSGAIEDAEESLGLLDALYGTADFARSHRWHLPDL